MGRKGQGDMQAMPSKTHIQERKGEGVFLI